MQRLRSVLAAASEHACALDINTAGLRKTCVERRSLRSPRGYPFARAISRNVRAPDYRLRGTISTTAANVWVLDEIAA